MNNQKVLFIGIDGADFDLMSSWLNGLPTFRRLTAQGVFGSLRSTVPPVTGPAWTSMFSGKNPGKTGIIDFFKDIVSPNEDERIFNSQSIKAHLMWDILSYQDKRSLVLSLPLPLAYPPYPINGVMVSGFLTPEGTKDITYPHEMAAQIPYYRPHMNYDDALKPDAFYEQAAEMVETRFKLLDDMLQNEQWDFCAFVIQETDYIQHFFYKHPHNPKAREGLERINDFFKLVDSKLGSILLKIPDDCTVVIASDHGFGSTPIKYAYLNTFLEKEGLVRRSVNARVKSLARNLLLNSLSRKLLNLLPDKEVVNVVKKKAAQKVNFRLTDICKNNLRALYYRSSGNWGFIKIYDEKLKARKKSLEKLREKIINIRDPHNNSEVVASCYLKEEMYSGPYMYKLPDIIVEFDSQYVGRASFGPFVSLIPHYRTRTSDHRSDGIFLIKGEGIKKGVISKEHFSIYDVMPTMLYQMGVPLPEDLDGRVRGELFKDSSVSVDAVPKKRYPSRDRIAFSISKEDERKIVDRLRALGYLE